MTTPENRQGIQHEDSCLGFDISAKRAISNAAAFASKYNSAVGVRALYEGVRVEMGNYLAQSDLKRKNIDPHQLVKDLITLEPRLTTQGDQRLSSHVKAVLEHAAKLARSRENPLLQRPSARDLLESIAVVARKQVMEHEISLVLAQAYIDLKTPKANLYSKIKKQINKPPLEILKI